MKKRWNRILFWLASLLLVLATMVPVQAMEAFEIRSYQVILKVQEDGVIEVTETMETDFSYPRHGIYVNLPERYSMNWELDGQRVEKSYVFPISDVEVLSGHHYTVTRQNGGIQIQIGDEDAYAAEQETYCWRYQVRLRDLDLNGLQALYYNLIGQWDTTIEQFSFEIEMPKSFDASLLEFYIGNDLDRIQDLSLTTEGTTIQGSLAGTLEPNESVTVLLPLPEGYFTYPDYSAVPWWIAGAAVVLAGLIAILFFKYGKDEPLVVSVEFSAPEGISSAEVGYILDGSLDNRDVVSLILDWGRKGYLKIEEAKGDLIFTRLKEPDGLKEYEKRMFQSLFQKQDTVSTSSLREKFYVSIDQCKKDLKQWMNLRPNRIFTTKSVGYRILTYVVTVLPTAVLIVLMTWIERFSLLGLVILPLPLLPLITGVILLSLLEAQRFSMSGSVRILYTVLSTVLLILYGGVMLGWAWLMGIDWLPVLVLVLMTVLLCFFGQRMIKRTERGHRLFGQVLGLRQFILVAEKDRLAMLVEENPMLFYEILPYAYAMNLTEVWADHFRDLLIPSADWYVAETPDLVGFQIGYALSRSMRHAQTAMVSTPPVQTGKGGGSFGGFGGGGFSGGGFGGSSGGSW